MAINYQELIDDAMLNIVKKILKEHVATKENAAQCFYISFQTNYPGVVLSPTVRANYPADITIVLEHQFRNLEVFKHHFTVDVIFNGKNETISVPFKALTSFIDSTSNFSLQLKHEFIEEEFEDDVDILNYSSNIKEKSLSNLQSGKDSQSTSPEQASGEIVQLDAFRNKSKK
ncbi:MAG: hypothetical protein DGJ47_000476 [Rickettsiaceae bacterium]